MAIKNLQLSAVSYQPSAIAIRVGIDRILIRSSLLPVPCSLFPLLKPFV
ncbi:MULTISPECIES: hypothetical protein [unclassified Moorena]|nr:MULTISPECIES: hypothetical protein [unclassified Moorena]NEO08948.1 hypothetical protein [Moorena sp. SIO3I8]NEP24589.1 hypothetical protein [Moorena sp. SIO3I6]